MQDLSLHLLDIAENSVRGGANLIKLEVIEDLAQNQLILKVEDNGQGMDEQMLQHVSNPFFTTRTTRRVGLGIPLLKQNCELSGGHLRIKSEKGKGTLLVAVMQYNHVDRPPLGDMPATIITLISAYPKIDWIYKYTKGEDSIEVDTRALKYVLKDVPINHPEILKWVKASIENLHNIVVRS